MLNIPISMDYAHDCLDSLVVAVANWYGCDHQLMFSESWEFEFPNFNLQETTIGENIIPNQKNNSYSLLGKYHGLYVNFHLEKNTERLIRAVSDELILGKPISIFLDTFWCPWYKGGFQEYHASHACLVVGFDENREVLYCIDGQMANDPVELSMEMLRKGCSGYLTFQFIEDHDYKVNWKELIYNSLESTGLETDMNNFFNDMVSLALCIKDNFDIKRELKGFEEHPFQAHIFKRLLMVERGRKQYAHFLRYIGEKNNKNELINISYDFIKAGELWSSIFGMMIKGVYIGNPQYITDRVSAKIIAASRLEKSIAINLMKILEGSDLVSSPSFKETLKDDFHIFNYVFLNKYYNNQGFGKLTPDCKAEFSNVGRFFLSESLPTENDWSVGNMKFRFPKVSEDRCDNIACAGNRIIISTEESFSAIMFLGSAEFGNHSEEVVLEYNDGTCENVRIEFSSWAESKPAFGECIAWTGKAAVRSDTGLVSYPFPVHIFAKSYIINKDKLLIGLILPQYPNIHIFSITLAR